MLRPNKTIINNSPFLTPNLLSNFDNEPIFNDLISESSEQSGTSNDIRKRLNEVTVNLEASRFKNETPPKKIKCSIELARIKNVGALLKRANNTSFKAKVKETKKELSHSPNCDVLGSILLEMDTSRAESANFRVDSSKKNGLNGVYKSERSDVVTPRLESPIQWDIEHALINEE